MPETPTTPVVLSLKRPEDCVGWFDVDEIMSDLSDGEDDETPEIHVFSLKKTTKPAIASQFHPRTVQLKKQERFDDDDKFPIITLNKNAEPFIPQFVQKNDMGVDFDSCYKVSESKLLAELSDIYYRTLAKEEKGLILDLDYYEGATENTMDEGTSAEAIDDDTMFDNFEGSSMNAIMQFIQSLDA